MTGTGDCATPAQFQGLSEAQLATRWGTSKTTVRKLRAQGRIAYYRILSRIVFRLEDVEAFEASQRVEVNR